MKAAERQSFTGAAEALRIERSQVTRRIQALEKALGVRLFQRSTRRIVLTNEGTALLERAERLLNEADDFFLAGNDETDGRTLTGEAVILASFSFCAFALAELCEAFCCDHPAVRLTLQTSERLFPVIETGADVVLTVGDTEDPSAVSKTLGHCASLLCASPVYLTKHPAPMSEADLAGHTLIAGGPLPNGLPGRRTAVSYGNAYLVYQAALRGEGIGLLPAFSMRSAIADGRLVPVLPAKTFPPLPMRAQLPSRLWVKPVVRAFLSYLEGRLTP